MTEPSLHIEIWSVLAWFSSSEKVSDTAEREDPPPHGGGLSPE